MTRELRISREAREDLAEAVGGFREISPLLVVRFGLELERIYSSILEYPQLYPIVYKNFRRGLIRRFPYSVFYVVEESAIVIMGVVHQARDESTWKRRA